MPQRGSDNPCIKAIIGDKKGMRTACANVFAFAPNDFAAFNRPNQLTMVGLYSNGARLIASVPPASTKLARPVAISFTAESSACMPEAQLRCTVHAGTLFPQAKRNAMMRAILASSSLGIIQPIMTSSISVGENAYCVSNDRPAVTAKSLAENGPRSVFAFNNGVRAPSTM